MRTNQMNADHSQYMLAHMIRQPDIFEATNNVVRPSDFINPAHSVVWRVVVDCYAEFGVLPEREYISLSLQLSELMLTLKVLGIESLLDSLYAVRLGEIKSVLPQIMAWIELIRRDKLLRGITPNTPTSVIIEELTNLRNNIMVGDKVYLNPFNTITGLSKAHTVPLGLSGFDRRINSGGIPKGRTALIMAGTSGGKTTILTNIAINTAKQRIHSLFVTLEDPEDEIATRMYACAAQIPHNRLMFIEKRTQEDLSRLEEVRTDFENYIHLYDAEKDIEKNGDIFVKFTVEDLDRVITDFKQNNKLDLVLVDYFNLITPTDGIADGDQAKDVTQKLKRLARKHDVVIVTACQTNRQGLLKQVVGMDDVAGYFNAAWSFDYVLGFGKADEEKAAAMADSNFDLSKPTEPIKLIMNIAKGKMMAKDKFWIWADFAYMTLREENPDKDKFDNF